jgi:endoglycosylceramidase
MRKTKGSFFILTVTVLLMLCACRNSFERQYITDDQGRALILHGLNVSCSSKYYEDRVGWTKKEDILRMSRDWGFNFARMLVLWDGIEPEKGVFDEAYLDRIAERLGWYEEAGIHVVLDMHQDLYSIHFGGDGAPSWAIEDNGWAFEYHNPWSINYLAPAVIAAFGNFWDYENPEYAYLQEHYTMAVMKIVERFHDHAAVIGYDLMNEPYPGYHKPFTFESQVLRPFYERLTAAIRTVDNDNWVFFEPIAIPVNQGTPSYLGVVKDVRPGGDRLAYFPHIYAFSLSTILLWEETRKNEAARQQSPMLIGELGFSGNGTAADTYLKQVMAMADRTTSGWAYWSYDVDPMGVINADGSEQTKMNDLVRVYPKAVAGFPTSYGYNPNTRKFVLVFNETGVNAPTEIYIPAKRFFPEGWKLETSDPAGSWSSEWNAESEVLKVYTDPNQAVHTIKILPEV